MFGDIIAYADFFFQDEIAYDETGVRKEPPQSRARPSCLAKFRDKLAAVEPFDVPHLEPMLHDFVAAEGIKTGDIIHAVRVATTGKAVGPGLYDCLEILGKETCLARIDRALGRERGGWTRPETSMATAPSRDLTESATSWPASVTSNVAR